MTIRMLFGFIGAMQGKIREGRTETITLWYVAIVDDGGRLSLKQTSVSIAERSSKD